MMKTIRFVLTILALIAQPARADPYEDAIAAVERGDYETAAGILKGFAEQGNPGAQAALALLYDMGHGVPQDSAEAVRWYRLAAAQGDKSARYNLAGMYDAGVGVAADPLRAYLWFDLSVAAGNKEAAAERDEVAKKLSAEQTAQAQAMAAACTKNAPKLCD